MSPSPASRHQWISGELHARMHAYFRGKRCRLFAAPMDVVLSEEDVVQPDLLVVCDPRQIRRTHIAGAPTLVVEILSEHSTVRDRLLKLNLYARAGVREYWRVTPWPPMVEVLRLEGGRYVVEGGFGRDQTLAGPAFPRLKIRLKDIFGFPLEAGEAPPAVRETPPAYRTRRRRS